MESKVILIGEEPYWFKFGLKGLIYLAENLNIEKEMNKYKICYAGLLANYPEIQMAEVFKFPLDESFMKSINEIFSASMLPSPQTIEE